MRKISFHLENIVIASCENTYYLTGLYNGDSALVISCGKKYYFTDGRYIEDAKAALHSEVEVVQIKGKLHDDIIEFFGSPCLLGVEDTLPFSKAKQYSDKGFRLESISKYLYDARKVKDDYEISLIKKAQSITDRAFEKILTKIKEHMTERELASELESLLFSLGGDGLAFPSIVAFGENTSKPHAVRGGQRLKKGDFITLDFGATYKGYCSDMTRTVCFGNPSAKQKEIYNLVLNAQNNALHNLKSGISCKQAFSFANDVFQEKSLSEYFVHSLGHGLGLNIHEYPFVSKQNEEILQKNTIISVEPGLYFPSEFGVRIEDIVILHENGIDNLTNSPKNLIIV